MKPNAYKIQTFYKFVPIEETQIARLKSALESLAQTHHVCGLLILGTEGLNATVSATATELDLFVRNLEALKEIGSFANVKSSWSDKKPFRRFKVAVREEIVSLGNPELSPGEKNHHLSPSEWDMALSDDQTVVIDTRNWYETQIGKFKNAIELDINEFREFPNAIKQLQIPKEKKVLMYCTGGIRCEKAILEMQSQGYENVFQLEGGILKYLEERPFQSWEGECFVFDHRVAVDQELNPSKLYALCPHCGQPSTQRLDCIRCGEPGVPCHRCTEKAEHFKTCSKNCAHQYEVRPKKGRPQKRPGVRI